MLRDPKVIEYLNTQLTNELTSINQYYLHARTLDHWGVAKLGKQEYAESINTGAWQDRWAGAAGRRFPFLNLD